jgi:hypothetical protein
MFDMQFMMAAVLVGALTRTAIAQEAAPGGWAPELVVDAFKKKHGVDILTAESFDREAWHDLKGQAMVDLYRELSAVCHARNKQFWIGLQLGKYTQFTVAPHFSANVVARYSNHWKTLVDEGIADAFVLGDYEQVSSPGSAYWREKKDIRLAQGQDLYGWAREHYGATLRGRATPGRSMSSPTLHQGGP